MVEVTEKDLAILKRAMYLSDKAESVAINSNDMLIATRCMDAALKILEKYVDKTESGDEGIGQLAEYLKLQRQKVEAHEQR